MQFSFEPHYEKNLSSAVTTKSDKNNLLKYRSYGKELLDIKSTVPGPQGFKTFFMLNSAEHEIYPAHKC